MEYLARMNQQLEEKIDEWRSFLSRHNVIQSSDVEELEDHLRSQILSLSEVGLEDDEAFLVAVIRLGDLDSLSREFAQEYSERLWKNLVVSGGKEGESTRRQRDAKVAVGLAFASGVAIKLPELFGFSISDIEFGSTFYLRNFSLFILPFLAMYFTWKRGLNKLNRIWLAIPFVAGGLIINLLPFKDNGHTVILAAMHLPLALWLTVAIAYTDGSWRGHSQRMNFVRFSGEWFIYYTLIALGGGVLAMFTIFTFNSIGLDAQFAVQSWILPCGIAGAVLISAWLVEAKQSIIENMVPVLTRLFTPLFTILLFTFLATMIWIGRGIDVDREVLIGFDLLLLLVLCLILYSISVRDPNSSPGLFDVLQFLLLVSAFLVDVIALIAIMTRISEFGFSPNRVAALGENLILLANLAWSGVLYGRFLIKRSTFAPIERWQTSYIPVYGIWVWIVVVIFPIVFKFQ